MALSWRGPHESVSCAGARALGAASQLGLNDFAFCKLSTATPVACGPAEAERQPGALTIAPEASQARTVVTCDACILCGVLAVLSRAALPFMAPPAKAWRLAV